MHFDDTAPSPRASSENLPWWKGLTGYQWFVFAVASLGWLFDTMDQQLFNLARISAVRSLLGVTPGDEAMARQATRSTTTSVAWVDTISQWILFMATILAAGQYGCE